MTAISRSALLPYSAREMYDLVADIESYPQFLPWCSGAKILSQNDGHAVAAIDISYHKLHKAFTTRNTLRPARSMEMELLEGPFSHLHGFWRFEDLGDSNSRISFDIEFGFSNRVIGLALGPVFGKIADSLVDNFRRRATVVYGERTWQV
jgi:ribosome-associated toxin RatA of RatAB toxin-antitoxin module